MDFEKAEEIPIVSQISAPVRNLFYQSFRFHPLRQLGSGYYRLAGQKIAARFQKVMPKSKLFLLNPVDNALMLGAYDLDFLIVKEKEISEKQVWELRADYFHLKRRFPVLGRVSLTQSHLLKRLSHSDCAASVVFSRRKRYQDGKWKSKKEWEKPIINPLSRLALSISNFDKAQHSLVKSSLSHSSFYRARFYQEIHESLYLSSGERLGGDELQPPALLLAHAFYQIQELANKLSLPRKKGEPQNFKLNFELKNGLRFAAETINRTWLEKLKKINPTFNGFRATPASLILSSSTDLGLIAVMNMFADFVNYLPALGSESEELPILLPGKAFDFMALGWHWSKPLSHLNWAYPAQLENEDWVKDCSEATSFRVRERLLLESNLILGKLISHSPEGVQKALRNLTEKMLLMKAKENLPENHLRKQLKDCLPHTLETHEWVRKEKAILNLKTLVPLAIKTVKEIPLILEE